MSQKNSTNDKSKRWIVWKTTTSVASANPKKLNADRHDIKNSSMSARYAVHPAENSILYPKHSNRSKRWIIWKSEVTSNLSHANNSDRHDRKNGMSARYVHPEDCILYPTHYTMLRWAAVRIQSVFRGFLVRVINFIILKPKI